MEKSTQTQRPTTVLQHCTCDCFLHATIPETISHHIKCVVFEKEDFPEHAAKQLCRCKKCTCSCTRSADRPTAIVPPNFGHSKISNPKYSPTASQHPPVLSNIIIRPPPDWLTNSTLLSRPRGQHLVTNDHPSRQDSVSHPTHSENDPLSLARFLPIPDSPPSPSNHPNPTNSEPAALPIPKPNSRRNRKNKKARARYNERFPCLLDLFQNLPSTPTRSIDYHPPEENDQDSPEEF